MSALADALLNPGLYFFSHPGDPASSEVNPFRKLPSIFETLDVSETVGDAEFRFKRLLVYKLRSHCEQSLL
jgi:hypothetical protein